MRKTICCVPLLVFVFGTMVSGAEGQAGAPTAEQCVVVQAAVFAWAEKHPEKFNEILDGMRPQMDPLWDKAMDGDEAAFEDMMAAMTELQNKLLAAAGADTACAETLARMWVDDVMLVAPVTKCLMALSAVQIAEETYLAEFDKVGELDDLYTEQLVDRKKVEANCAWVKKTSKPLEGENDWRYEFQAAPKGTLKDFCVLILNETGINNHPLPVGCTRDYKKIQEKNEAGEKTKNDRENKGESGEEQPPQPESNPDGK